MLHRKSFEKTHHCALVEITAFILESKSFTPMRALQFLTDHVIFKLCYDQTYQMKTTIVRLWDLSEIEFFK